MEESDLASIFLKIFDRIDDIMSRRFVNVHMKNRAKTIGYKEPQDKKFAHIKKIKSDLIEEFNLIKKGSQILLIKNDAKVGEKDLKYSTSHMNL